jgi:predicted nuclease with TOPRIM domain
MGDYLRNTEKLDDSPGQQKNQTNTIADKIRNAFAHGPKTEQVDGSKYGAVVRAQVLEVVVRQAIAGAPWQEICRGPMEVNNITIEEVEEEVQKRRGGGGGAASASKAPKAPSPLGGGAALSSPSQQIKSIRLAINKLATEDQSDEAEVKERLKQIGLELAALEGKVQKLEWSAMSSQSEAQLQGDLSRELERRQQFKPRDDQGPHRIT